MSVLKHVGVAFSFLNCIIFLVLLDNAFPLNVTFQQSDYQMKFERFEMARFNKEYMKFYKITTYKYNRTTPVVNFTYEYKIDMGYDIEVIIQAYTFLSNEYRVFPIRFEVNWCEAFSKNYIGLGSLSKCGNVTGCPQVKGKIYHACNWSPEQSEFPPLIPDGRYMLELQGVYHDTEVWVLHAFGIVDRPIKFPFGRK